MNTTENSEIVRLTDDNFDQIFQKLACKVAVLRAVQQVETGGRGGFLLSACPLFFLKDIFSGVS